MIMFIVAASVPDTVMLISKLIPTTSAPRRFSATMTASTIPSEGRSPTRSALTDEMVSAPLLKTNLLSIGASTWRCEISMEA